MRAVDYDKPLELVFNSGEIRDCSYWQSNLDEIEVRDLSGYFWVIKRETGTTLSGLTSLRNKQEKELDMNGNKSFIAIVSWPDGTAATERLSSETLPEAKKELHSILKEYDDNTATATIYSSVASCSFKLDWLDE